MRRLLVMAALVLAAITFHAQPAACVNCLRTACVINQDATCGPYCLCASTNRGDTQGICVLKPNQQPQPFPSPYIPRRNSSSHLMDALRHVTEQR